MGSQQAKQVDPQDIFYPDIFDCPLLLLNIVHLMIKQMKLAE